jgi:hypothetical protein
MSDSQLPLRFDVQVPSDGRVELLLPLSAGAHVTLYVVEKSDSAIDDLLAASTSSTDFWNNSEDDEDWDNA